VDILSMWAFIEASVKGLDAADKEALENSVRPFELSFSGFDGNNDPHFGVADFLINTMGRFDDFKGRPLNSHSSASLPKYRRMLSAYNHTLRELNFGSRTLSADQIAQIIRGGLG